MEGIQQAAEAAEAVEKKKKLTSRMRGYANDLIARINEKEKDEKSGEDVPKLSLIRRILMTVMTWVTRASAWVLDRIEELCRYVADLLGTAGRPITSTVEKIERWYSGTKDKVAA